MASLLHPLKTRLLTSAFAGFLVVGTLTVAGSANAQTPTALPAATPYAQSANIGNPAPINGTQKRVALVIGNSAYENVTKLPNPANDARAMGQFLNTAGFEVIMATDLDHDEMIQVLQNFSAKIAERGPNTAALVYYAGHGLQIAGDNYLVPVDAKINSEADVATEAVRLVDVMATLQAVPSALRIGIFDACRDNPFTNLKDTGRGLAIVDAPNGTIVAYSTAPGTQALDGEGKNSPYTEAFMRAAHEKNLPIEQFFKKVRVAVNDATDGKQTPWESSSLTSDFYFFGDTEVAAAKQIDPAQQANVSANRRTQVAANMRSRTPRDAYGLAIQEGSVEYYQEFVQLYPYDPYAEHIRRLLAAKLIALAWHGAVLANTPVAYQNFYSQYPDSIYAMQAVKFSQTPLVTPLYQPTKIFVPPQLAPQVKLTTFNGVNIGQGNAPIGLGGNGTLFNKHIQIGNGGPGNVGPANGGLGNVVNGGVVGPKLGLPGNGQNGNPIGNVVNGGNNGQVLNGGKPIAPGVDLAKGVNRIDTKIDGGRLTTLPGANGTGQTGNTGVVGPKIGLPGNTGIAGHINGVGTPGNGTPGNGTGGTQQVKVLNGNTGIVGRPNPTGDGVKVLNGQGGPVINQGQNNGPVIKRIDHVNSLPVTTTTNQPTIKRFEPGNRVLLNGVGNGNGNGNGNGGSNVLVRKPITFNGGNGGNVGNNGGNRMAGGFGGFGRMH